VSVAAGVGWLAAALAGGAWLLLQRGLSERMEAVARACHELRGPLTAARLGLELGTRGDSLSAAQLRAIELELGRATLALDDLARAPERRRSPVRPDGRRSPPARPWSTSGVWSPTPSRPGARARRPSASRSH
jgi:signal transduction histidine kinase